MNSGLRDFPEDPGGLGGGRSEGSRSGFLATWFFGGLGYQGNKTTLFQDNTVCLAVPPSAARPKTQYFHEQMWFFGLGFPRPPKNHLAQKPFRDPFEQGHAPPVKQIYVESEFSCSTRCGRTCAF